MRVLHLIPTLSPCGDSAMLRRLLRTQFQSENAQTQAVENRIFVFSPVSEDARTWFEGTIDSGVEGTPVAPADQKVCITEICTHFRLEVFWQSLRWLRQERFCPDVIHIWGAELARPGIHLAQWLKAESIVTLRHAAPKFLPDRAILRMADHLTANSLAVQRTWETLGVRGNWTLVPEAPEPVSLPFMRSHEARAEFLAELNLPSEAVLAGCVGPIADWKRWHWAVWTIDSIVRVHPEMHLLFFDPELNDRRARSRNHEQERERRSVTAFVRQYEREERVHFVPFRSDFAKCLSFLDFFWNPQSVPGAGMALMEAATARVPIVSAEFDGLETILPENACIRVTGHGETTALASATHRLWITPDRKDEIVSRAAAAMEERRAGETLEVLFRLYQKNENIQVSR